MRTLPPLLLLLLAIPPPSLATLSSLSDRDPSIIEFFTANLSATPSSSSSSSSSLSLVIAQQEQQQEGDGEVYLATANRAILRSKPCPALLPPVAHLSRSPPRMPGVQVLSNGRGYRFFDPSLGEWTIIAQSTQRALLYDSDGSYRGPCAAQSWSDEVYTCTVGEFPDDDTDYDGDDYDDDDDGDDNEDFDKDGDEDLDKDGDEDDEYSEDDEYNKDDKDGEEDDTKVVVWAKAKMLYRCYVMLQHACPVGVDNGWDTPWE